MAGTLEIRRVSAWRSHLARYSITVDGRAVAKLADGGHVSIPVGAGPHAVQARESRWWKSNEVTVDVPRNGSATVSVQAILMPSPHGLGALRATWDTIRLKSTIHAWAGAGDPPLYLRLD